MKSLKLLGVLMDYPRDEMLTHGDELRAALPLVEVSDARRERLSALLERMLGQELLAAQEAWLGLFDRGRSMSLLLFEHIHGESRDRGQAMVDLVETYRKHGFDIAVKELPDYLPLVLEFLSTRPVEEVSDWLSHFAHILELLAARAQERESDYAVVFESLIEIAQGTVDLSLMRRRVSGEPRDDTPEAMDKVWEEEAVRFGVEAPSADCDPPRRLPAGIKRHETKVTP
jgi:nitrate reductase delta subunit